ncbi:hypothetical protein AAZV13_06G082750 [Glycine max]
MANHGTQQHQRPRQHCRSKARHGAARPPAQARVPLRLLLRVASAVGGIQFGWALQLSLLMPYVQQLGIPHVWAALRAPGPAPGGPLERPLHQPLRPPKTVYNGRSIADRRRCSHHRSLRRHRVVVRRHP